MRDSITDDFMTLADTLDDDTEDTPTAPTATPFGGWRKTAQGHTAQLGGGDFVFCAKKGGVYKLKTASGWRNLAGKDEAYKLLGITTCRCGSDYAIAAGCQHCAARRESIVGALTLPVAVVGIGKLRDYMASAKTYGWSDLAEQIETRIEEAK